MIYLIIILTTYIIYLKRIDMKKFIFKRIIKKVLNKSIIFHSNDAKFSILSTELSYYHKINKVSKVLKDYLKLSCDGEIFSYNLTSYDDFIQIILQISECYDCEKKRAMKIKNINN